MNIRRKKALFLTIIGAASLPLFTVMVYAAAIAALRLNLEGLATTMLFGLPIAITIFIIDKKLLKRFEVKRKIFLLVLFLPSAIISLLMFFISIIPAKFQFEEMNSIFSVFSFSFFLLIAEVIVFIEIMVMIGLRDLIFDRQ